MPVHGTLTVDERRDLRSLELVVDSGLQEFLEVGSALKQIHDRKLYRDKSRSFEDYVSTRFMVHRSQAYRLMECAEVKPRLEKLEEENPDVTELYHPTLLPLLKDVPEKHIKSVVETAIQYAHEKLTRISKNMLSRAIANGIPKPVSRQDPSKPTIRAKTPNIINESEAPTQAVTWAEKKVAAEAEADNKSKQTKEALDNASELNNLVCSINKSLRHAKEIRAKPGLEVAAARRQAIIRHLENAKSAVISATPDKRCKYCKGSGCAQCGNLGWVNSAMAKQQRES